MNIQYKKAHFIGIGGIGVSALANIYAENGIKISGSDSVRSSITEDLEQKGKIFYQHQASNVDRDTDVVIYSPAILDTNLELQAAKNFGIKTLSYPQALGQLTKNYFTIAIAGTHGKSTTTAMTALAATASGLDPTVVIGTKIFEFQNKNYRVGKSRLLIIEACEYKESFLNFEPDIILITNVEPDHLDYFKTAARYNKAFEKFKLKLKKNGKIFYSDKLQSPEVIKLNVPGSFNQENARLALAAIGELHPDLVPAKKALEKFSGTWRRLQFIKKENNTQYFDDYAHHPTEIKATLKAFKEKYGKDTKILTVFQPHQYNRTYELLEDFAKSFDDSTRILIPNIYEVRDTQEDMKKISAAMLAEKIGENAIYIDGFLNCANYIKQHAALYDIVITMGAGDIYQLQKLI